MRYRTPALALLALSVILFIFALVMGFRTFGGHEAAPAAEAPVVQQEAAPETQSEAQPEKSGGLLSIFRRSTPTPEPTAIPTPSPEPTATPWPGPTLPEQAVPATKEYFNDAGFLGNSVLSGLWMYDYDDLLPDDDAHWYWDNGLTVLAAVPYAEQMSDKQFGKIYVGFGNNEMSYDRTALREAYNMLLDKLQADHPGAIIYLVSATPVSLWKSSNSSTFTREYVQSYNEMVKEICAERQVWYMDAYSVLCNEEGYLPSDVTNDGTHFTPAHYEKWYDYMQTHYIPTGTMAVETTPVAIPPAATDPAEGGGA